MDKIKGDISSNCAIAEVKAEVTSGSSAFLAALPSSPSFFVSSLSSDLDKSSENRKHMILQIWGGECFNLLCIQLIRIPI